MNSVPRRKVSLLVFPVLDLQDQKLGVHFLDGLLNAFAPHQKCFLLYFLARNLLKGLLLAVLDLLQILLQVRELEVGLVAQFVLEFPFLLLQKFQLDLGVVEENSLLERKTVLACM